MKKRWTYKVRCIKDGLMKKLEEYGNDGWEAFKIEGIDAGGHMVYLKREKEEDEE